MAACLLVVMGTALITAVGRPSMALGAFIAGLLLAETEYRREIEVTIEPFKGLLLGLFFVSIGAGLDLRGSSPQPVRHPGVCRRRSCCSRASSIFASAWPSGCRRRMAREMALLLGPGGEFAFVMIGAGGRRPARAAAGRRMC